MSLRSGARRYVVMSQPVALTAVLAVLVIAEQLPGVGSTGSVSTPTCLADAIPVASRVNVTIDGVSMPVGLWELDWPSAKIATHIFQIIASEYLGYHTRILGPGCCSSSAIRALAGCPATGPLATRTQASEDCFGATYPPHQAVSEAHFCFEVWEPNARSTETTYAAEYPDRMPQYLGDMGYPGVQGAYLSDALIDAGLNDQGLALDFYRAYNMTWFQPWRHFDSISSIDTGTMEQCASLTGNMADDTEMQQYRRWFPNDPDGIEEYTDDAGVTKLRAKCTGGVWWLSPACRQDTSKCVPYITSEGWATHLMMHRATQYNLPFALASQRESEWVATARTRKVLFYRWEPDTRFLELANSRLIFPPTNLAEQEEGLYITASRDVNLAKWGAVDISDAAPLVHKVAEAFHMPDGKPTTCAHWVDPAATPSDEVARECSHPGIVNLLVLAQSGVFPEETKWYDSACSFVKNAPSVWEKWVVGKTVCQPGQGLVDEVGRFIETRPDATSCEWCSRGRASAVTSDGVGVMRICNSCEPGYEAAASRHVECNACTPGKFAAVAGSSGCDWCPVGKYSDIAGATACKSCPSSNMETRGLGATAVLDCECSEGFYLLQGSHDTCEECKSGMVCKLGSMEANIPSSRDEFESWTEDFKATHIFPAVQPGFWSSYGDPLSVFECMHQDGRLCPGGAPESCHEYQASLVCGSCAPGCGVVRGRCSPCGGSGAVYLLLLFLLAIVLAPLGVLFIHRVSRDSVEKWNNPRNGLLVVLSLGWIHAQTCNIIGTCALKFPQTVSDSWSPFYFANDLTLLLRLDCSGIVTRFETGFIIRLFLPLWIGGVFAFAYGVARFVKDKFPDGRLKEFVSIDERVLFSCFGASCYNLFIGIVQQSASVFQCYRHPNNLYSMVDRPEILCYGESSAWNSMVGVGVIAVLVNVALLCKAIRIVWIAPSMFPDRDFQKTWKFLFIRSHPSVRWWCLAVLIKAILINLATVFFSTGARQVWWLILIMAVYTCGVIALSPWRCFHVNIVDCGIHCILIFVAEQCSWFDQPFEFKPEQIARWVAGVGLIPIWMIMLAVLLLALDVRRPPTREELEAQAEKFCTTFESVCNQAVFVEALCDFTFTDLRILTRARRILAAEILQEQPPGFFKRLVYPTKTSLVHKRVSLEDGWTSSGLPSERSRSSLQSYGAKETTAQNEEQEEVTIPQPVIPGHINDEGSTETPP